VLANQARQEIVNAVENNLLRIFSIIKSQPVKEEDLQLFTRQDDDDDAAAGITPNPNVIPQVAQILGAIFSGSLNITKIADGTVGLVPNILRNQVAGFVKLVTGENVNLNPTTTTAVPFIPPFEPIFEEELTTLAPVIPVWVEVTQAPVSTTPEAVTKGKYRVRNKTRRPLTPSEDLADPAPSSGVENPKTGFDDETEKVERLEKELLAVANSMQPYERQEPRQVYGNIFSNLFQNVNMTEVAKAVPSIFKGATQALSMLENLGLLENLPGSEAAVQADIDGDGGNATNEEEE